ncbi:MAG: electron transfer flavoprotein, partial [Halovenus sp.]
RYGRVVQDVRQEDGRVVGVTSDDGSRTTEYDAEVVIDAAGAMSILQDRADFSDSTFDTKVNYRQFCSAYREIIEVPEPVEYEDSIVFMPTEELGYLWYFPRTPTTINAGLGFQMNKPPMELIEVLRDDLRSRPEFAGATVLEKLGGKDKLGAALPTRRPYDSAVAPGFVAVGDSAGHVNPTTGGGIPGAAKAGHWAAQVAANAISDGDLGESALWEYNWRVQTDFGKRFAAMDLYNIFGSAHEVGELTDVVTALPGEMLIDLMGRKGETSLGWVEKIKTGIVTAIETRGHWGTLHEGYKVSRLASELKSVYDEYPSTPSEFEGWKDKRDAVMETVYETTGADPKY